MGTIVGGRNVPHAAPIDPLSRAGLPCKLGESCSFLGILEDVHLVA